MIIMDEVEDPVGTRTVLFTLVWHQTHYNLFLFSAAANQVINAINKGKTHTALHSGVNHGSLGSVIALHCLSDFINETFLKSTFNLCTRNCAIIIISASAHKEIRVKQVSRFAAQHQVVNSVRLDVGKDGPVLCFAGPEIALLLQIKLVGQIDTECSKVNVQHMKFCKDIFISKFIT